MKKKYILNGKIYDAEDLNSYAQKSGLSFDDYLKESGATEHNDTNTYLLNGKEYDGNTMATFAQKSNLPYDEYLKEAGVKKKESTPSVSSGGTLPYPTSQTNTTGTSLFDNKKLNPLAVDDTPAPNFNPAINLPTAKDIVNNQRATSDNPIIKDIPSPEEVLGGKAFFDKRAKEKADKVDKAIGNTVSKSLRNRGLDPTPGTPLYNKEYANYKLKTITGDAHVALDENGTPGLKRNIGTLEGLSNGWDEAMKSDKEASEFMSMTPEQRVAYLQVTGKNKPNQHPEYIGDREEGIGSSVGGALPFLAKAGTGAAIGTLAVAAAPESAGTSLSALPTAGAFLMTAPDMVNHGAQDEIIRRYQILKNQYPNAPDVELMKQADAGKWSGGATGLINATLFSGEGVGGKAISNESKSLISNSIKSTLKSSAKVGAITGATEGLKEAEGNLEGIKTDASTIAKNVSKTFGDNATTTGLLTMLTHHVPAILKSTFKYALAKDVPAGEIKSTLDNNVSAGVIHPEVAEKLTKDIEDYKTALNKTAPGLTPETEASVAGLIQKRTNIENEAKDKDASAQPIYKSQIDAINQQIADIQRTGKPLEHEIDEATGEPYKKPTYDDVAKQKVEELADRISRGKRIENSEHIQVENLFPDQLEKALNKIAREEKSGNADKENPNTELSDNINKYLEKKNKETENNKIDISQPVEIQSGAVDETAPISESDLLGKAKDLVNKDVVKGFTAEHLKEIANTNPEKLKEYLSNIADQAHDEHSVRATVDTYGKDLVDIATTLFPENKIPDETSSGPVEEAEATTNANVNDIPQPTEKTSEQVADERAKELLAKRGVNVEPPTEPPIETGNENSDNQRASGASHRSLTEVAKRLGLPKPVKGEVFTPEEYTKRGKMLYDNGADYQKMAEEFEDDGKVNADMIGVAKARTVDLAKVADDARIKFGKNSDEFKKAQKEYQDWSENVMKPMGTKFYEIGGTLQGDTDLDTGSFIKVKGAIEDATGKQINERQEKAIQQLTEENKKLKQQAQDAEARLISETDKNIGGKKEVKTIKEKGKQIADLIRKGKLSRPDIFSSATPASVVWDGAIEAAAKTVELTANIAQGISDGIEHIRKSDWYNSLSQDKKNDAEKQFSDFVNSKREKTREEKSIEKLEKQLKDLQNGKVKTEKEKIELSDKEKDLKQQIKDEKEALSQKINPVKGSLNTKNEADDFHDLVDMFADHRGNKFTTDEAKEIWEYAKSEYLDKGVLYKDMVGHVANDLGLTFQQAYDAIQTPKTKPIANDMWMKQKALRKGEVKTKDYVEQSKKSLLGKIIEAPDKIFRATSVFGHGGIFVGTHAGMTVFDLPRAKYTLKAFINGYKFAYGNDARYERKMQELKSRPNYVVAQRAGLQNDPNETSVDQYQKAQKYLGKLGGFFKTVGESGVKGFNAIKVLRQDLFDSHYDRLTEAEKADPNAAKAVAELVNNATGGTNLDLKIRDKNGNVIVNPDKVFFAANMESARWEKLTKNPIKATGIALKALIGNATPAEKVFAKVWAKRVGWELGTYISLAYINAGIQSLVNPKNPVNLYNPTKPDYMKYKVGDNDVNMTSGMLSSIDFIAGLVHAATQPQKELRGDTRLQAMGKNAFSYGRGKLAPFSSTIADFATQTDFSGNPLPFSSDKPRKGKHQLTWSEYAWQKAPIPVADAAKTMYESMLNNGMTKPQVNTFLQGIISFIEAGSTGFRISESYHKKEKETQNK